MNEEDVNIVNLAVAKIMAREVDGAPPGDFSELERRIWMLESFDSFCNITGLGNFFKEGITRYYGEILDALEVVGASEMAESLKECKILVLGEKPVPVNDLEVLDEIFFRDGEVNEELEENLDRVDDESFSNQNLFREKFREYLLQALEDAIDCPVVIAGGVADHVHLLVRLSRTLSVSDALKAFKTESSKWMKSDAACPGFAWQAGYGVFSVSASHVEAVTEYIRRQPEHHRRRDFKEEFRELLKRYRVTYDEAYVWD